VDEVAKKWGMEKVPLVKTAPAPGEKIKLP
jgi:hypothetical protein